MSKQDAYREKFEAKIDEQSAKLSELKAQAKGDVADAKIGAHEQIETLEGKIKEAKGKLAELAEAGEDAWEELSGGLERAWGEVTASAETIFKKFTS